MNRQTQKKVTNFRLFSKLKLDFTHPSVNLRKVASPDRAVLLIVDVFCEVQHRLLVNTCWSSLLIPSSLVDVVRCPICNSDEVFPCVSVNLGLCPVVLRLPWTCPLLVAWGQNCDCNIENYNCVCQLDPSDKPL